MKHLIAKFSLLFLFLFSALGINAQNSTPVFTCDAIITSVNAPASPSGLFRIGSVQPNGGDNDAVTVSSTESDLIVLALIAQSNGTPVTLVVRPVEEGDTRCRDNNERLTLLGIF